MINKIEIKAIEVIELEVYCVYCNQWYTDKIQYGRKNWMVDCPFCNQSRVKILNIPIKE